MKRIFKAGRTPAVAGLLLSFCLGMFVTATMAPQGDPVPEVEFYCDTFDLLSDGSVQAWVDVRVKNIQYFRGISFNLEYDKARADFSSYYFRPSKAVEPDKNQEIPIGTQGTRDFFAVAPDLYVGSDSEDNDPFEDGYYENKLWGGDSQNKLSFSVFLKGVKELNEDVTDRVEIYEDAQGMRTTYIDTSVGTDEGVTIGSLSFRVNPEKIPEIVKTFERNHNGEDLMQTYSIIEDGYLEVPAWEVIYGSIRTDYNQYIPENNASSEDDPLGVTVKHTFVFPDNLVRAALMEDYVRVNAWEAYASGDWSDVAALLQRYSGQLELGYANGDVKREVFPWGAANNADDPELQPDYTIYELDASPADYSETTLKALTEADWEAIDTTAKAYSPKSGVYKVEQCYCYTEDGEDKRYPVPVTAYAVIDPVKLTGAWADKLYLAKTSFSNVGDLELPKDTLLQTEPNMPRVSLLLPVDAGWHDQNILPKQDGEHRVTYTPQFVGTPDLDVTLNDEAVRVYPWLTTEYDVSMEAVRELVDSGLTQYNYEGQADREVDFLDPTDVNGKFTIQKFERIQSESGITQTQVLMENDQHSVQLYLPNGMEIGHDWFNTDYIVSQSGDDYVILLDTSSDNVATGCESQIGSLKAYLNLGGWFGAVVTDRTSGTEIRSNKVNIYLEPRENTYVQDEVFDFTGHRAGLLPLYASSIDADGTATVAPLSTTVTLPMDHFVKTLYDGVTGEPDGRLNVVKIQENLWKITDSAGNPASMQVPKGTSEVFTHGPDHFREVATFDGYGSVYNKDPKHTVTIKTQYDNPDSGGEIKPMEILNVYYNGTTNPAPGPDVDVVYDTKQQGYIYRQEITLTLKNEGTTDISGIYIDPDYDPFVDGQDPQRGHYEVLRTPASYLPAGGETTFVLTYVYDLTYNTVFLPDATGTTYLDTLAVGTNNTTVATTFTAQFRVTKLPVSKVTVVTIPSPDQEKPGGNIMGEAEVMVGFGEGLPNDITSSSPAAAPNTAPGSTTYEADYRYVWIRATPASEYEVNYEIESVYYFVGNEKVVLSNPNDGDSDLGPYLYTNPANEREKYYYFRMPYHDTTVYVKFYEPTLSKLRLSKLLVYAAEGSDATWGSPKSTMIDPDNEETNLQTLRWDDRATNELLTYPSNTAGAPSTASKLTLTELESSYDKFFSVLPINAEYAQISFSLRETLEMVGLDEEKMNSALPEDGWKLTVGASSPKLDGAGDEELVLNYEATPNPPYEEGQPGWTGPRPGNPLPRTSKHFTYVFDAPDQGKERIVTIWLRYEKDPSTVSEGQLPASPVERSFQVRLLRKSETPPNQLNYGNSPYGMIMADVSVARKDVAKQRFRAATEDSMAYAFDPNLADPNRDINLIPQLVLDNEMYQTYWPGVWGGTNYDEHETVLFAVAGEMVYDPGFKDDNVVDGAGNPVSYENIFVKIIADTLDTTAMTQVDRFKGSGVGVETDPPIGTLKDMYSGVTWEVFSQGKEWRPGVYENGIEYSYTDYDGTTARLYRPLVIVATPGDVNADGRVDIDTVGAADRKDELLVENRVTDPLGYTVDVVTWSYGELHRLRSCDVNNDKIMNNIDANAIKAKAFIPYYLSDYKVVAIEY